MPTRIVQAISALMDQWLRYPSKAEQLQSLTVLATGFWPGAGQIMHQWPGQKPLQITPGLPVYTHINDVKKFVKAAAPNLTTKCKGSSKLIWRVFEKICPSPLLIGGHYFRKSLHNCTLPSWWADDLSFKWIKSSLVKPNK